MRDGGAVLLLLAATGLPWNLYFGTGIPGSSGMLFAALIGATVLSVGSVVATYTGHDRLRLPFSIPYVLLVMGFVAFAVAQEIRYGGTAVAPPGLGPGAWVGVAGALLAAQPIVTGETSDVDRFAAWLRSARLVGLASMVLAALSVGFNLYWRTRLTWPGSGGSGQDGHSFAIIATATVYAAAALVPVIVGCIWLRQRTRASRLAAISLAVCSLASGIVLWFSPVGREVDAFHGIAQITSTSGVGFEGYLAWVAGAAIVAPLTFYSVLVGDAKTASAWGQAARKALLLIAVWCLASVAMRVTDVIDAATLGLEHSNDHSAALIGADLAAGTLALWLRNRLGVGPASPRRALLWCAILVVLAVTRVVAGTMLAPHKAGAAAAVARNNPVYGNALAQQITSTFDVVLCGLALMALVVVALAGARSVATSEARIGGDSGPQDRAPAARAAEPVSAESPSARPRSVRTHAAGSTPATSQPSSPARAPRLFREPESPREPPVSAARVNPAPVADPAVPVGEAVSSDESGTAPPDDWARLLGTTGQEAGSAVDGHPGMVGGAVGVPGRPWSDAAASWDALQGVSHQSRTGRVDGEAPAEGSTDGAQSESKTATGQRIPPPPIGDHSFSDPADPDEDLSDAQIHGNPTGTVATPPAEADNPPPRRPLADSSQRFPAGMTYTGAGPVSPHAPSELNPKPSVSQYISSDSSDGQSGATPVSPAKADAPVQSCATTGPHRTPGENRPPLRSLRESTQRFPEGLSYDGPKPPLPPATKRPEPADDGQEKPWGN